MASSERGAMANEVESSLRTIFRRCVQCPDTTPVCPPCKSNQICSLVPATCQACAYNICINNPAPAPANAGPNIGAIAGGVIGGIIGITLVVFLIWRFWIKKRREQQEREMEAEEWEDQVEDDIAQQKRMHSFNHDAASTRTRGSLANSILSRASNIIQIAYIPGVTNRNGGSGSGHNSLVGGNGPVPPIPAAQRRGQQPPKSPLSNEGDMLFFRPGDLRDSSYSATSSLRSGVPGNRDTTYTQHSITPSLARLSMGSEGYRDSTVETPPVPATTVARVAPRMVSIRTNSSGNGSSEPSDSPKTESRDFADKSREIQVMMPGEGSGASPSSSMRGKAKQVTVGGLGAKGRFPVRQPSDASVSATSTLSVARHVPAISSPLAEVDDSEEEDGEASRPSTSRPLEDLLSGPSPPLVQPAESPFFDASERPPPSTGGAGGLNPYSSMGANIDRPGRSGKAAPLSDIIEEATKRASRIPSHEGLGGKRDNSPFSDANRIE
ncbi:overproduction-induced pheromone-resistant [Recurvomyces mirabilis]|nr:overproduction-induced pheromone-resistant [Recurvomyces mirabilis]